MGDTGSGETWTYVTVDRVGSRLDGVGRLLPSRRRHRLAEAIFEDVLQAIRNSRLVDQIVLVTGDADASALGRKAAVRVVNSSSQWASEAPFDEAADRVAFLRGDLALMEGQDLAFLLGRVARGPRLVLVPTPGSPGLSVVAATPDHVLMDDFEGGNLVSWQEGARDRGLDAEVHAISAGMRPSSPPDLLQMYIAARASRAKALLKGWHMGPKLRQFEEEKP